MVAVKSKEIEKLKKKVDKLQKEKVELSTKFEKEYPTFIFLTLFLLTSSISELLQLLKKEKENLLEEKQLFIEKQNQEEAELRWKEENEILRREIQQMKESIKNQQLYPNKQQSTTNCLLTDV
jgi:hypothetical protein